jgi:hypothetical protein
VAMSVFGGVFLVRLRVFGIVFFVLFFFLRRC